MKRLPAMFGLGALTAAVLALGAFAAVALATDGNDNDPAKVRICHASSSTTNPYTSNPVSKNSIVNLDGQVDPDGHGAHTGLVFPAADWGDIIPPFAAGSKLNAKGEVVDQWGAFGGLNWTDAGQAIYGNCEPVTPPPLPPRGTLVVNKVVVNDDGGTKIESDFSFTVNGRGPFGFESDGSNSYAVDPGSYAVAEVAAEGYTSSGGGTVSIAAGETKTVTITNDDVKKEEGGNGMLIVIKVVINDDGGTAEADDFSFRVNGRGPVAFESDGSNSFPVPAGYVATVVEVAAQGYTTTYSESNGGTVEKGGTLTITVTNDDVKGEEPPPPPSEVKGDASVSCILPDGFYRVSGTVDGQAADEVAPATIPGNFAGSTEVTSTRGDTSFRGIVTTDGKCGNAPTPPAVTPPAVVSPPPVVAPPAVKTPTTVPTAPFTPPKASTKPAAPVKVKKATTTPTKPTVKVAGAVASNPPTLAYTP